MESRLPSDSYIHAFSLFQLAERKRFTSFVFHILYTVHSLLTQGSPLLYFYLKHCYAGLCLFALVFFSFPFFPIIGKSKTLSSPPSKNQYQLILMFYDRRFNRTIGIISHGRGTEEGKLSLNYSLWGQTASIEMKALALFVAEVSTTVHICYCKYSS